MSPQIERCKDPLISATGSIEERAKWRLDELAPEILVEIFSHCPIAFPRIDLLAPPLTLAVVCKTWYHLVMNTPSLWSSFEIVLEGTSSSPSEQDEIQRKLSLWLRRSRQKPLSIRIIQETVSQDSLDMRAMELIEILLPHASRWQYFDFRGPTGGLAPFQEDINKPHLRSLKSISLQVHERSRNQHFDLSRFNIPWSQLSILDLRFSHQNVNSLDKCYEILSETKNLESCILNAECIFTPSLHTGELKLPSINSLKLIIQGNDPVEDATSKFLEFLHRLCLPRLRAFTLEWLVNTTKDGNESQWRTSHTQLVNFLHSSGNSLQHLELAYLPLLDHEIIRCLDGLSGLKSFGLKFALADQLSDPITDTLLQHLSLNPSTRGFWRGQRKLCCPGLKSLKLQCSGDSLSQTELLHLLGTRVDRGLKEFELFTLKSMSRGFRDRIAIWKGEGLDFKASELTIR
ncbi:hypothetical protein NP233_g8357 [Leucocoprinus birnbaumii]|uniref:F-box domain-containing protein n=1 Tax=Leucocoprinus birnbaumii TaxID=56174 RepID=A0AAD5VMF2_9AGAR|nr:hypothetical protein NP233_g8357 [Leucocoprinus birnbaumii]